MKLPDWWGSEKPYKIIGANAGLSPIPDEVIDCCITSPPYWGKRDYGTNPLIWDGDPNCEHDFEMKTIKVESSKNKDFNERSGNASGKRKQEDSQQLKITTGHCSRCGAWSGELGHEPSPDLFIKHLCDIFDEVKRILKPTGTCWVNLGDSYGGAGGSSGHNSETKNLGRKTSEYGAFNSGSISKGLHPKSLLMIPARFAIEMINRGWTLRNRIIWHKPSVIPEPFDDRFTVDYEIVFFFVKSVDTKYWIHKNELRSITKKPKPDYIYKDLLNHREYNEKPKEFTKEEISCPYCNGTGTSETLFGIKDCELCEGKKKIKRWKRVNLWKGRDYWFEQQYEPHKWEHVGNYRLGEKSKNKGSIENPVKGKGNTTGSFRGFDQRGRHKRSVWSINPGGFSEAHFAVFPNELISPMIKAGCPRWICGTCGQPKERIYNVKSNYKKREPAHVPNNSSTKVDSTGWEPPTIKFKGWSSCDCVENLVPGILIDPFLGSGTSLEEARKLGRQGLGFEIQKDYEKFIIKRSKCDIAIIDQDW